MAKNISDEDAEATFKAMKHGISVVNGPGLIDAASPVGLLEFGQVGQASDLREVGRYNPHIRAIAAVQPHYPDLRVARMIGITAAGVVQVTGTIQGTMGVVQLSDDDTWERVAIETDGPLVVKCSLMWSTPKVPATSATARRIHVWRPTIASVEYAPSMYSP